MKKFLSLILALLLLAGAFTCLASCGSADTGDAVKLSFKSASGYDYLKTLDGRTVSINGYLATSSPADGSFIFLMNLPFQSCPFCKPNTSQLSNTMEVYPKKGKTFGYTTAAVRVTGKLEVAPSDDKPFTDQYGYEFNFKIVDAEYSVISAEELGEGMALWQSIAESGIVNEMYSMFDYLDFVCNWPNYKVNSYTNADGSVTPGYYLYASDALKFIKTDGAQFNYGYQEGYYSALQKKIASFQSDRLKALLQIVEEAKSIAARALTELEAGNYTSETKYVEEFGTTDDIYSFPAGEALMDEYLALYTRFADWLGEWEM